MSQIFAHRGSAELTRENTVEAFVAARKLGADGVEMDPMQALVTAREHGHRGLHPFFLSVDEALVRAARAAHVKVRIWTLDDPARIAELGEIGVDAVITNDVTAARRTLGRTEGSIGSPRPS